MLPSDDASMDESGEGRILAATYLSHARVMIDLAVETLEDHSVEFTFDRNEVARTQFVAARAVLESLADEIMAPFEIANVLQLIEEVLAGGEIADRATILRATIDAREDAREDEEDEPTDEQIYNRPGMEGGIGYPMSDMRDEHDPSL